MKFRGLHIISLMKITEASFSWSLISKTIIIVVSIIIFFKIETVWEEIVGDQTADAGLTMFLM
jgi:hypothetical protein